MSTPTLTVKGVDLTAYVTSWGTLDAVRKLKLSDDSLFSSAFRLPLDNTQGDFTEGGPRSLFPKGSWAGAEAVLMRDGMELYRGFVTDLEVNNDDALAFLTMSSSMSQAADVDADLTGTDLNPAMACLALLEQGGLGALANTASFSVAAGFLNGYPIDVTCPRSAGESCLSLGSKIADICSLDFILVRGRIYCRVQRPFDGSGLRQEITGDLARTFGQVGHETSNFANVVNFSWGGSGDYAQARNELSIKAEGNREVVATVSAVSTAKVGVSTEATAQFYADLLLARTSPRRRTLPATLGPEFNELLPGWRFPVTYEPLCLASAPFELDEAQLDLDKDEWRVKLSSLEVIR